MDNFAVTYNNPSTEVFVSETYVDADGNNRKDVSFRQVSTSGETQATVSVLIDEDS